MAATGELRKCRALQGFGRHFGIAFQVLDDCRDLLSDEKGLGKTPGQDLLAGDVTLPLMHVLRQCRRRETEPSQASLPALGACRLVGMSEALLSSQVPVRIARVIASHVDRAKQELQPLAESSFKDSLCRLADHLVASASGILAR